MTPLRITDGYVELAATVEQTVIELYVQEDDQPDVTSLRLTQPVAIRLAWWIFKWWFNERWCGWKSWFEARALKKQLNL